MADEPRESLPVSHEDARILILQMLRYAMQDVTNPSHAGRKNKEAMDFDVGTANGFIFDDEYLLDWGEWRITPTELLGLVDLDIEFVRRTVRAKQETEE